MKEGRGRKRKGGRREIMEGFGNRGGKRRRVREGGKGERGGRG